MDKEGTLGWALLTGKNLERSVKVMIVVVDTSILRIIDEVEISETKAVLTP